MTKIINKRFISIESDIYWCFDDGVNDDDDDDDGFMSSIFELLYDPIYSIVSI